MGLGSGIRAFSLGEYLPQQDGVIRAHHFLKQVLDGAALVSQHAGKVIEGCRALLRVTGHYAAMQYSSTEHAKGRFAPVVFKPLTRGVYQHGSHVLHIRYR